MSLQDNSSLDMALLVIGFDGYSDLWDDYFRLLNKYWPDRKYPTYLSDNTLQPDYEKVTVINAGADAEWSRKVQVALQQIEEPYVCLLLEDFFTGDVVDSKLIDNTVEFIKKENIKYYKLNTFSKIKTPSYKNLDYIKTIPGNLDYGISLQPGIWKKEFLSELLGTENYNAWNFEFDRIKESRLASKELLEGCVFDTRNILMIQHGVVQGKFLPPVVEYFKNKNEDLNTEVRGIMPMSKYRMHRFKIRSKAIIPAPLHKIVKRILNLFGMTFVSDKHA